jgi:uncharacterized protein (TIGR03032 family)
VSPQPESDVLAELWRTHDAAWRDPALALSPWAGSSQDPRLLQARASGPWWETLDALGVTLLITREYEHLVVALSVQGGRPHQSFLPLPHPSGLAVQRRSGHVSLASTRNPNQVYELRPVEGGAGNSPVLLPVRSRIFPGALYIHDLAWIGDELYANSVGQNAIVRLSEDGSHERVWWPKAIERAGGPDFSRNYLQLNSIAAGKDVESSFYSASSDRMSSRRPGHRNFPVDGRGVVFSGATREPIARGLTRPHSARLHRRRVWVANSGYGQLGFLSDGQLEVVRRLPGWTRGLCFCGDVAIVGTSRVIPRFRQYAPGLDVARSRCGLHAIGPSGEPLGSLTWPYGNQIFAIDWLDRSLTSGLPLTGARGGRRRLSELFYGFDNPRRRRTR